MLHLLLGRLRWSPDAVWCATPREVAAALGRAGSAPAALGARELQALMRLHPDRPAEG